MGMLLLNAPLTETSKGQFQRMLQSCCAGVRGAREGSSVFQARCVPALSGTVAAGWCLWAVGLSAGTEVWGDTQPS